MQNNNNTVLRRTGALLALAATLAAAGDALAIDSTPDMGKFLATGGVSEVDGAGGGGITPWALITGYGTRDSWGANAHYTYLKTQDYSLGSYGVAVDAVYEQDSPMPQLAVGVQYKRNKGVGGLGALGVTNVTQLGARDDHGYDYYVSATKILFEQSLLLNGTLRATKANQMGILGFGGDKGDDVRIMPEASAAYLINRKLALGAEYRNQPHNLGADANARGYYDVFLAYFPTKNVSLTAAYANLGQITIFNTRNQSGWYLSLQTGF